MLTLFTIWNWTLSKAVNDYLFHKFDEVGMWIWKGAWTSEIKVLDRLISQIKGERNKYEVILT